MSTRHCYCFSTLISLTKWIAKIFLGQIGLGTDSCCSKLFISGSLPNKDFIISSKYFLYEGVQSDTDKETLLLLYLPSDMGIIDENSDSGNFVNSSYYDIGQIQTLKFQDKHTNLSR